MNAYNVPSGWRSVTLGEVVEEALNGFACGLRDESGIIQLRMNNVSVRGSLDWTSITRVPREYRDIASYKLLPNDVLFNNTNSAELVGKSALFPGHEEPVVFSNHFTRLRSDVEQLLPGFLAYWLQLQWNARVFERTCNRWIGQAAVKPDKLLKFKIPLPTLAEQRRIVSILNEQLAAVEEAKAAAEARLEAARGLPAQYLRAAFKSPKAQSGPLKTLENICNIQLGKMLSPKSKTGKRPIPYLRNANVQWNRFDLSDVAEMDFDPDEQEKFSLLPGDLVVCEGGEPGRSAVWEGQIQPCCYQKALHRLRPKSDLIDPYFLMYRLWLGAVNSEFDQSHAKTTIAHLPAIRLRKLFVRVPSLSEQHRIAEMLNQCLNQTQNLLDMLDQQFHAVNALSGSLLQRIFHGGV